MSRRRSRRRVPAGSASARPRACRPTGRSSCSSRSSSSVRLSSSATYAAVSSSVETASLTCSAYDSSASTSSAVSTRTSSNCREPVAKRPGGPRARRERDVVRHGGPEARGGDPLAPARVLEHAHDPGRSLVARVLQPEALDELGVAGRTGDRGAARVCGTSASSEPSVTTSSTSSSRARSSTSFENVFQRRLGSTPSSSTASRAEPGMRAW